jgi:putative endonuclease
VARTDTRAVGADAENIAYRYLKRQGLIPVRRNFQCRLGELDLIMQDGRCLVIIEVRFRGSNSFVAAGLTIDSHKQRKIIRTTAMFLAWNERFANHPIRFDVLGINADAHGDQTIEWIRDAFRPADSKL